MASNMVRRVFMRNTLGWRQMFSVRTRGKTGNQHFEIQPRTRLSVNDARGSAICQAHDGSPDTHAQLGLLAMATANVTSAQRRCAT